MKASVNYILNKLKKLSLNYALLLLLFIGCLLIIFAIADMIFEDKNVSFDQNIFSVVGNYITPFNTKLLLAITFFGSQYFLLPATAIVIIILLVKNQKWDALK